MDCRPLSPSQRVPFKAVLNGTLTGGQFALAEADLILADAEAKLTKIVLHAPAISAHIDTNTFALAPVASMLTAARPWQPGGNANLHGTLALDADHHPALDGTIALSGVSLTPPKRPPITHLNGLVRLAGHRATIGPLTFNLGSGHARLQAEAQSLQPPRLTYRFNDDRLVVAELVPSRNDDGPEYLANLTVSGTATGGDNPSATVNSSAESGMVNNVPFDHLALAAAYAADRVTIRSLTLNACDGTASASGVATIGDPPAFDLSLSTHGLNLQKALTDLKAKAANTVRGLLDADLELAGHGHDFDRIRPTLRGSGKAQVTGAKLVGVNVAAQALRKIDHLPAIGALVPGSVIDNHPELFKSPDTDIQSASLTFVIVGPRITTHDFFAQAVDYTATANGWFDLDKYLDMNAQIILSQPFSSDLIAARKNVAFLADRNGQVIIPLRITGRLPTPQILPNIDQLAQRAASHAVEKKLGGLLGNGGKGLGGLFHGKNPLQGLFH